MGEEITKKEDTKQLRCANCNKVLAKQFEDGHFEIKCSRCEIINIVSEKGVVKKV